MAINTLTEADCRKATPNDGKLRKLFDGHGLMLAILPSGNKVWRMAYRNADGKQQTAVIGPYALIGLCERAARAFAYLLFGDTAHLAAVIHDWLFHHHEICDEKMANRVLLEAAGTECIALWRRLGIYLGVAVGGKSSWNEDGKGNGHLIVDGRIV